MSSENESQDAVGVALHPGADHILAVAARELDETLMPELQSQRARTVAHMLSRILRHLSLRHRGLATLLEEWTAVEEGLLAEAGGKPPGQRPREVLQRNREVSAALERVAAQRVQSETAPAGRAVDDLTARMVRAERDHYAARDAAELAVKLPARSPERQEVFAVTAERLAAYLSKHMPHQRSLNVTGVQQVLGGFSKETFLADLEVDGAPVSIVIRRDLSYGPVDSTVADEFPVLRAVSQHGLPVPMPLLVETDRAVFGEPFIVTNKAPGTVCAPNTRGVDVRPEHVDAALGLAEVLARLHRLDIGSLGLPKSYYDGHSSTTDYVARQIDSWERSWKQYRHEPSPTIAAAFAWLHKNLPIVNSAPRIVHGDAGLHNLLMHDGSVSAMLDWELTHPGDPVEDLAFCRTWVDPVIPWEQFLARYHEQGGPQYRPERETFYGMLTDLRVAVMTARSLAGFERGEHPELSSFFGGSIYLNVFLGKVAARLTQ